MLFCASEPWSPLFLLPGILFPPSFLALSYPQEPRQTLSTLGGLPPAPLLTRPPPRLALTLWATLDLRPLYILAFPMHEPEARTMSPLVQVFERL